MHIIRKDRKSRIMVTIDSGVHGFNNMCNGLGIFGIYHNEYCLQIDSVTTITAKAY